MIMGANAYSEVLTVAGCDIHDVLAGYSSQGPSIPNMPQHKPDLTAYTHFLGSKTERIFVPDTGTSAACAVAAGCIAALRTKLSPTATPPAALLQALRATARHVAGPGWHPDYGYGIIDPVAAGKSLGLIP
jgi:subtilisin family serine protease